MWRWRWGRYIWSPRLLHHQRKTASANTLNWRNPHNLMFFYRSRLWSWNVSKGKNIFAKVNMSRCVYARSGNIKTKICTLGKRVTDKNTWKWSRLDFVSGVGSQPQITQTAKKANVRRVHERTLVGILLIKYTRWRRYTTNKMRASRREWGVIVQSQKCVGDNVCELAINRCNI